jgi:glycosyltransferase involved in cell wall biosynthesis
VAQLGARLHYAVPVLLARHGLLAHFFTDAYVGPGSRGHLFWRLLSLIPEVWQPFRLKRLGGRQVDGLPPEKVTAFNLFGLRYHQALRRCRTLAERERVQLAYGREFCKLILRRRPLEGNAVYAQASACRPLFQHAQGLGLKRILEQYSAPPLLDYEIVAEEHRRFPGWEPPYPGREVWEPRITLGEQEWSLADTIICPSRFVAEGLASLGQPAEKIAVIPYGVDVNRFQRHCRPWDGQRPLRVLFVGAVTLRKGPQYLYLALKKLNSRQLTARLVGPVTIKEGYLSALYKNGELIGPVSRDQVQTHYQWADVFVFPSLCEGSALVTYEALAAGLPVITTGNAGSVVREGQEGFIVPLRDSEAVAERLERLAADPGLLAALSRQARARAQEFSWERYGEKLAAQVAAILANSTVSG